MIFADSSYFIAIADRRDQWHKRAIEISKNVDTDFDRVGDLRRIG